MRMFIALAVIGVFFFMSQWVEDGLLKFLAFLGIMASAVILCLAA